MKFQYEIYNNNCGSAMISIPGDKICNINNKKSITGDI